MERIPHGKIPEVRRRFARAALAPALALALLVGACVPAAAEEGRGLSLHGLGAAVAAWTAGELGQPLPESLPRIALTDAATMQGMRYGAEAERGAPAALSVLALYDDKARTIHLPEGWTGADPREMSILVHEMVHHLQNVSGRRFACPSEREAEAFEVQERWLALFGESLTTSFDLNPLTLLVLTRCGL